MNQFVVYEQLCDLEDIARRYENGREYEKMINAMQERIASELYRVAVIGEFKRGKSSLVNAIIGAQVLPTDILPMTAAVTRVTYGEERRIIVHYKDGRQEERSVEQLIDFATKFDAEKEKTAATIREIEVHYPSVLCKNHIDIIDTPGLNDNEAMTDVTLGVLGDIDAAIMVISANEPLSLTEQGLILNMIGQRQIRHIIFAVTHIDAVSSRPARQDAMIDFIRGRLCGDLMSKALERWQGDQLQTEKVRRILEKPDIFGVSSVLAMDGFIQDNEELLEQSRFPVFKRELLALLTAAQSADVIEKTKDAARDVRSMLPKWHEAAMHAITQKIEEHRARIAACEEYYEQGPSIAEKMAAEIEKACADAGAKKADLLALGKETLRAPFARSLSAIREETNSTGCISGAIREAAAEVIGMMDETNVRIEGQVRALMNEKKAEFEKMRLAAGYEASSDGACGPFAAFKWVQDPVPAGKELRGMDVIDHILSALEASLGAYADGIAENAAQWKNAIAEQCAADLSARGQLQLAQEELERLETRRKVNAMQHEDNLAELKKVLTVLEIGEEV